LRSRLEARKIPYEYLDGGVEDRAERVARFQGDPSCPLSLISLKAGGTGLNLTAADYVFILEPWWNPAVEAQPVDRTHRIGQSKPVFVYRLLCRDTVEEKVVALEEPTELIPQRRSIYLILRRFARWPPTTAAASGACASESDRTMTMFMLAADVECATPAP
jgi:hypothetical protein